MMCNTENAYNTLPLKLCMITELSLVFDINNIIKTILYECSIGPDVQKCIMYLHQIFVDKDVMHDTLKYFASFLDDRGNKDKIFGVFVSKRCDAKRTMEKLIRITFGKEFKSIPYYAKSPYLSYGLSKNTKIVRTEEFHNFKDINPTVIKELTSDDDIWIREYYENGQYIKAKFKLIGSCYDVSMFNECDEDLKKRIKIIPLLSCDDECHILGRFLIDDCDFWERVGDMAVAFRWILQSYLRIYEAEGLKSHGI